MGFVLRVGRGAVTAVLALGVPVVACASAEAAGPAGTTGTSGTSGTSVASPSPTVTPPTPIRSVPSEAELRKAQDEATATAAEVADITAKVEVAEARLETLQRAVSEAVAADEQAQQRLADAEAAVRQATLDLAVARKAHEDADRALSAGAALMYMQGSDLQSLTTLLLSPPNVMSDLSVVLDQDARQVRQSLDDARAAALEAASRERLLVSARDTRAGAAEQAGAKRAAAEKQAKEAGAEAAKLGQQQEELTARLAELEQGVAGLAGLREAAARLGRGSLLGVQSLGSAGSGPRAAQETARSMMASHGWDDAEFTCLVALWQAESGWSWSATNPSSGAYGIPQSLPGWKMASAGSDWLTNPATQIAWGMGYIDSRYGSPCGAYDAFLSRSPHWY